MGYNSKNLFMEIDDRNNFGEIKNSFKGRNYIECLSCGAIKVEAKDLAEILYSLSRKYGDRDQIKHEIFHGMMFWAIEAEPDIEDNEDYLKWYLENESRECTLLDPNEYGQVYYFGQHDIILHFAKECECLNLWRTETTVHL